MCFASLDKIYIAIHTIDMGRCGDMMTAKIFENGRNQAVRLPKEDRFNGRSVGGRLGTGTYIIRQTPAGFEKIT